MWKILDTGVNTAQKNMEIDAELLEKMCPNDPPLLHFYEWAEESGTYGYFLNPDKFLNLAQAKKRGVALARRPTGGGIVFHVSDLAFSALVPAGHPRFSLNTLENYHFINDGVKWAVNTFFKSSQIPSLLPEDPAPLDQSSSHFCMAKPTIYDVMIEGKKVAGAAQRRRKQGYLHQGSIAIALPQAHFLEELLLPKTRVLEGMRLHTFPILGADWTSSDLQAVRLELKRLLRDYFSSF
jgi:lipoate-protein ligase A